MVETAPRLAPAPRAAWRRHSRYQLREWGTGYLLASPFILGLLIFVAFPMGYSVWLVLHSWDLLSPPEFIGLENISRMLKDPQLEISLANTAFYSFLGVPLHLAVAFALAMLLDQPLRGRDLFRTGFYLPSITPAVATAVLWARIFHPEFGILNEVIGWFGVPPQKWLFEPELAKPAFILMGFSHIGPQMVIFLAGLQSVPATLMEAAGIDGASAWQRFRHITIPMISPVILFNLVVGIIGSFQVFTSALIMTNGGPQNATLFAVLYIYRNGFQYFKMGYAASLAWLLFTIIVSFTVVQFLLSRHWVYYEESR